MKYWPDGFEVDCTVIGVDQNQELLIVKLPYEHIETSMKHEGIISFKIVDIKSGGFLVLVKGLYAYVPFNLMPWNYSSEHPKSWEALLPWLKETLFFGKINRIVPTYDNNGIERIFVDATINPVSEVQLCKGERYEGVIIHKTMSGIVVEVGYHFGWKCGSVTVFLHISKFLDIETFDYYEPGQNITVRFAGKNEYGLNFETEGYIDLHAKFAGKKIPVKVLRKLDGSVDFTVEDKYKAILPPTRAIYGENRNKLLKAVEKWQDGKIIECEVLAVRFLASKHTFIIKWTPSDDLKAYIGKTVRVKVCRNVNGALHYLVENKYNAKMLFRSEDTNLEKEFDNDFWSDGRVVYCLVLDVEPYTNLFYVEWLSRMPDRELPDINVKVVGKIELNTLNQRTRPVKKSKRQLEKERKMRAKQSK